MSTIEEVKWYCHEKNSIGALLISGKWGCGKTYLIEKTLKENSDISSEFEIIRVSLFGEISPNEMKRKVMLEVLTRKALYSLRKNGINASEQSIAQASKFGKLIANVASKLHPTGELLISTQGIQLIDLVKFPMKINDKRLLLVFDDVERSSMNIVDLLGCINEFVETKKIKTIVIANEEAICNSLIVDEDEDDLDENNTVDNEQVDDKITYAEIKEKVISRTIKHTPDFDTIVEQIVASYNGTQEYLVFLKYCISHVQKVFRESKTDNIRTLLSGLQDFERLYYSFREYKFNDNLLRHFLYTFLVLEFEIKNSNMKKGRYGYIFADTKAKEKYSEFKSNLVIEASRIWLTSGEWDQQEVNNQISELSRLYSSEKPNDVIMRSSSIVEVDDAQFEIGFPIIINMAYNGCLTIDEYIVLLRTYLDCIELNIPLPIMLDFEKLQISLEGRIKDIYTGKILEMPSFANISMSRVNQSSSVLKIYNIIQDYKANEKRYKNKNEFIRAFEAFDREAIWKTDALILRSFDVDMADAVSKYYCSLTNIDRLEYRRYLNRILKDIYHESDNDYDESIQGLETLITNIETNFENQKAIACALDDLFIKNIRNIISTYNNRQSIQEDTAL